MSLNSRYTALALTHLPLMPASCFMAACLMWLSCVWCRLRHTRRPQPRRPMPLHRQDQEDRGGYPGGNEERAGADGCVGCVGVGGCCGEKRGLALCAHAGTVTLPIPRPPPPHTPSTIPGSLRCAITPRVTGVKESDTGLSKPNTWNLIADKQLLEKETSLMVRACLPAATRPPPATRCSRGALLGVSAWVPHTRAHTRVHAHIHTLTHTHTHTHAHAYPLPAHTTA
jgi:hypothetical protein